MAARPLFAATFLALALTGCGVTPPAATQPPTSPSAATSAPASPDAPSSPAEPTSPEPSLSPLVVGGTTLGEFSVGSPEKEVTAAVAALLGEPTDTSRGPLCELDSASHYSTVVNYDTVWVTFAAADAKKTSPRTLFNWGAVLAERGLPKGVVMQDDVPLNLGWKQLKAKYPDAKSVKTGVEGTQALRLPNKLLFTGDDIPLQVQGGEFTTCE
jgi:hypothetical protein